MRVHDADVHGLTSLSEDARLSNDRVRPMFLKALVISFLN